MGLIPIGDLWIFFKKYIRAGLAFFDGRQKLYMFLVR